MKSDFQFAAALAAAFVFAGSAQAQERGGQPEIVVHPTNPHSGTPFAGAPGNGGPPAGKGKSNGIDYHGGPVMLGTVNMYYIWYGN